MNWEVVIGLEIHAQLACESKIFSNAPTAYGAEPNTQANVVDLAIPGVLPVLNARAVELAVRFGLAVGAEIGQTSVFARKNYFYPDSPKAYQISQFELPIVGKGEITIEVDGQQKTIGITRAHLEEDAGKSLHEDFQGLTGIDLNRAGTPLLEIVSEPDMRSAAEAVAYAKAIHELVQFLEIGDGNMQEGSFRVDVNVSLRQPGEAFGTRTELKNINSFKFIEKALAYEIDRHIEILEAGGEIVQETRLYDPERDETRSMRSKEEANDYRYFPDPDLLPVVVSDEQLAAIKAALPELPGQMRVRFEQDYGLSAYDAQLLTASAANARYFDALVAQLGAEQAKLAANWMNGELAKSLNKADLSLEESPIAADALAGLLIRIVDNTVSGKLAKQVFEAMWAGEGSADQIIDAKGLKQITDSGAIEKIVDEVLAANAKQVEAYKGGQEKMFGFFVGQVMKLSKGQANPAQVNDLLQEKLKN
ncbi:Asp-tRNA(Asn)/Glu-tRNA(Gln) amidotransferase subunit GatB [Thiomicrospira cyclica]|uniref:Aspartyl/glutamyl-tRNA(Asn/Gln) amidotransferase subunit B n=1 Tax=Thiomicrospira cyclica (strain DSM 14477 / JCM 11371 / ALM1) TaxID=717773 RepID=F6D988_THICA|nr:Asp-tRNA(Asn)/Glu-tRNA(Gln) amidotransferase subunit GatB [Thiomicrospira cyclica]AEG32015.1 Aspartyl/glutamyl-tRNA(Asn/Gln) amidotransferase subunit B [Thiomicrospira cyclica ALM1]